MLDERVRDRSLELIAYEKHWIDGLNGGDVSPADETFASNCIIHMAGAPKPNLSVAEFIELVSGLLTAPDFHVSIEDQMASGDKVAFRWVAKGTHSGPLGEAPPTGKQVRFDELIFDHVVGGQVVERWEQCDQMAMLTQLGLVRLAMKGLPEVLVGSANKRDVPVGRVSLPSHCSRPRRLSRRLLEA